MSISSKEKKILVFIVLEDLHELSVTVLILSITLFPIGIETLVTMNITEYIF